MSESTKARLTEVVIREMDKARGRGDEPRVHGNGFIQLDLTDSCRLHVWGHAGIPRQQVQTPIHDHVFGFESYCLVGRLVNVVYETVDRHTGCFEVYEPSVRKGEDTELHLAGVHVDAWPKYAEMVDARSTVWKYQMFPGVFHETFAPEPTATMIRKEGLTQAQGAARKPRVLVPRHTEPDNEFRRDAFDTADLWRIVEEVLLGRS